MCSNHAPMRSLQAMGAFVPGGSTTFEEPLPPIRPNCGSMGTLIQRIQNQTLPGVGKIYNRHDYRDEMREALTEWDKALFDLLN